MLKRYLSSLLGLVMLLALLPGQALSADKATALTLSDPGRVSVGDEITLTATLSQIRSNEKPKYLSDQVIRFVLDGVEIGSAVTNATGEYQNKDELSGQATLTYKVTVDPGYHTVWAYFDGDDKYDPVETFTMLPVKLPGQQWTYLKGRVYPTAVHVGDPVPMSATLWDSFRKPVVGHTIIFQVDKKEVGRAITDENGTAVFTYEVTLPPGRYTVGIFSEATAEYAQSRMFAILVVR